nr:hypothetical protein Q903MT_gene2782 [Picea sitchensis]
MPASLDKYPRTRWSKQSWIWQLENHQGRMVLQLISSRSVGQWWVLMSRK